MPAVRLTELRREIGALLAHTADPSAFARHLRAWLERYGERVYQPGHTLSPPLLPAYHLPPAAFKFLWQALRQNVAAHPDRALPLAEALWQEEHLEPRLLAARLLGMAPPDEAALERFWAWLNAVPEPRLQEELITHGAVRLVAETPQAFLQQALQALPHPGASRRLALQALVALVRSPAFEAAPRIYHALRPVLLELDPAERPEAAILIQALAQRWPQEVGPFLRRVWVEALERPQQDTLAWVIRRVLPYLPEASRARLQDLLSQATPPAA